VLQFIHVSPLVSPDFSDLRQGVDHIPTNLGSAPVDTFLLYLKNDLTGGYLPSQ
jgi:hypothetical protein